MTQRQPHRREGDRNAPATRLQVMVGLLVFAASVAALVPQDGTRLGDLRPLALGLIGLGMVAWLAARRRRQATPASSR